MRYEPYKSKEDNTYITVKELIVSLLDCYLDKQVSVEYPTEKWWLIVGNYCRYNNTIDFNIGIWSYIYYWCRKW